MDYSDNTMRRYSRYTLLIIILLSSYICDAEETDIPRHRSLEESLVLAGPNRSQLQMALKDFPGPDMELLIANAQPMDLVHLTRDFLAENMGFSRKTIQETFYGRSVPYEIWQQWVLPFRILDEPLDHWRKYLNETLTPVVVRERNSLDAAWKLHEWLWKDRGTPEQKVFFEVTENRDQSPLQVLQNKKARCIEINMLFVAMCRSVGIPARIAGVTWWARQDSYHYWVEVWDTRTRKWHMLDGSNYRFQRDRGHRHFLHPTGLFITTFAYPAFPREADLIGKERWDQMIMRTADYKSHAQIEVSNNKNIPFTVTAYIWNTGSWRSIYRSPPNQEKYRLTLGDSSGLSSILLVIMDTEGHWDSRIIKAVANHSEYIVMDTSNTPFEAPVVMDLR